MIILSGLGASRTGTGPALTTPSAFAPPQSSTGTSRGTWLLPKAPVSGSGTKPPADPQAQALAEQARAAANAAARAAAEKLAIEAANAAAAANATAPPPPQPTPLVVEDVVPGAGAKVTVVATEPVAPPKAKWKVWAGIGAGAAALVGGAVLLSKADGAGLMGLGRARRRR